MVGCHDRIDKLGHTILIWDHVRLHHRNGYMVSCSTYDRIELFAFAVLEPHLLRSRLNLVHIRMRMYLAQFDEAQ